MGRRFEQTLEDIDCSPYLLWGDLVAGLVFLSDSFTQLFP